MFRPYRRQDVIGDFTSGQDVLDDSGKPVARAVVRNSPIMILDEPTAALDTESEQLVIDALRQLMKGRTVIMIAHRLSTIASADKIIVLKDGVVVEQGSNDDLLARGGVYAELHRIQYGTSNQASAKAM